MLKKVLLLILGLFLTTSIEARSGCCSHHGGVCGCGCCDGSGLSATCLPYYPECNAGARTIQILPTSIPLPTATTQPIATPTKKPASLTPTHTQTLKNTNTLTVILTSTPVTSQKPRSTIAEAVQSEETKKTSSNVVGNLAAGGIIGFLGIRTLMWIAKKLA